MGKTKPTTAKFQLGDWVTFPYGTEPAVAQIIEDRGPLGIGGQRIYRIRLDRPFAESDMFEITEDDVEQVLRISDIRRYLEGGGLLRILERNQSGGTHSPRAWLTLSPKGEITHTLDESHGLVGGRLVPFFTLHDSKIFEPKMDKVLDFLSSFGLDRQQCEAIVRAVGTAP